MLKPPLFTIVEASFYCTKGSGRTANKMNMEIMPSFMIFPWFITLQALSSYLISNKFLVCLSDESVNDAINYIF